MSLLVLAFVIRHMLGCALIIDDFNTIMNALIELNMWLRLTHLLSLHSSDCVCYAPISCHILLASVGGGVHFNEVKKNDVRIAIYCKMYALSVECIVYY